jgi:tetratricopeptide (TPR) repeat protein
MKKIINIIALILLFSVMVSAQTAKEWNKQGIDHFKKLEYKQAFECFTKAIEMDPKYGEAYYNRANAWFQMPAGTFPQNDGCDDLQKAKSLGFKGAEAKLKDYGCE